jgi:hypothetical protein
VDASGGVTLTRAGGDLLEGGVSAAGDFVAVAGGSAPGDHPVILLLLR